MNNVAAEIAIGINEPTRVAFKLSTLTINEKPTFDVTAMPLLDIRQDDIFYLEEEDNEIVMVDDCFLFKALEDAKINNLGICSVSFERIE